VTLVLVALIARAATGAASPAAARSWSGGVDLYRSGVFATQQTWLWCTAADVQIIRNIKRGDTDHSRAAQQRYFDYMRAHNRYNIPVKDGVDPAGWAAGLRHYVDARYRVVVSSSFDAALRDAVTNLRRTNLPVAIAVSRGNHAWVVTGFTATADPATTTPFRITSVRVVGPLWGLQSRSYGYDMRPDTRLTPAQLRTFFTPWHYAGVRMAWEARWVSIQPIAAAPASQPKATSSAMADGTPGFTPTPRPQLSPASSLPAAASAATSDSATPPTTQGVPPTPGLVAANAHAATLPPSDDPAWNSVKFVLPAFAPQPPLVAVLLFAVAVVAASLALGLRIARRRE
jgi:hypothetical protein